MEEKKQGKTLEICALVFGILSIVTCCCCFGFWGVIGLILAIVALAKGRKSGLTIAGLICSIVGVLGSLLIIVYLVFSPSGKIFRDEFNRNFKAGFQEGFESAYEGPDLGNVTEDFTESSDDVKAETNVEDDGNEQIPTMNLKQMTVMSRIMTMYLKQEKATM